MNEAEDLELEAELYDRLKIDPASLDTEFINCPANIAYLGAKHGTAVRAHLMAKIHTKKMWALYLVQAREDLQAEQEDAQAREDKLAAVEKRKAKDIKQRITESMVESRASAMPSWFDAQAAEVEAEVAAVVAKTNLTAMLAKRDMLVQMGANLRAEMERDPIIRSHKSQGRHGGLGDAADLG